MRVWGNLDWENPKGRHSLFHFLSVSSSVVFALYLILLAILIVIPRLSLSRGKKEKWDVLFWLLLFSTDGAQKQMVLVLPLYGSYIQPVIISRGLHYRPGLKIEGWRGLLRVKGMMVHPRPLQVCLHLLCVPSGFHGLFVLPQLLMVVSFSFRFWVVALFSSRDLISTHT